VLNAFDPRRLKGAWFQTLSTLDPDVVSSVWFQMGESTLCRYDAVTHLTDAQEWAGNGSMVGAIKGSTKQEPIVAGTSTHVLFEA
jgi:hypothetical protein